MRVRSLNLSILLFVAFHWVKSANSRADDTSLTPAETTEYAEAITADGSVAFPEAADERGIGSRFGDPGDKWTGGRMACAPHDQVNSVDHVCAHRWYPCGTILVIEYPATGLRNWCVVADRGPYGANVFAADGKLMASPAGGSAWYVKVKSDQLPPDDLCPDGGCTGRWRGVIDMSPIVSKSMGHPGMGYVKVWTLKKVIGYQKYLAKKRAKPLS